MSHFLLIAVWDSIYSLKKFAGENLEIVKNYPEDDDYLLEKEDCTQNYQIFHYEQEESRNSNCNNSAALGT